MDENKRIRTLIKTYRLSFELTLSDLVQLTHIKQSTYRGMEIGSSAIDFNKINKVAKVYGLPLWEFINPNQEIPEFANLDAKTKELILSKNANSNQRKQPNPQLSKHIEEVLHSGNLPREFTSSDIWALLPPKIKERIPSYRVTDSLKKRHIKR